LPILADFSVFFFVLGDVARYAPRLIKSQHLGDSSVTRIGQK